MAAPLQGADRRHSAISPITLEDAQKHSAYWQATELQTLNMARFFLASTQPHYLKDAPGGAAYLTDAPRR